MQLFNFFFFKKSSLLIYLIILIAYLPQFKLLEYCKSKGIHCSAYSPLGSSKSTLLKDETLEKIAKAHDKSIAQVLISWGITRGSVLPKSVNPEVRNTL